MPNFNGPIFNGEALRVLDRMTEEISAKIGDEAKRSVLTHLGEVLRHPTGRYESRIRVQESGTRAVVDDQRSVYGPWLEGTGSRNATTRFKGYATFRRVLQEIEVKSGQLAEEVVARNVGRMQ